MPVPHSFLRNTAAAVALVLPWLMTPPGEARAAERAELVRTTPLAVAREGRPGFTRLPGAVTGLAFTNRIAEARHLTNQILLNGSGIACADVDADGRVDVFLCGFDNPNALFRNLGSWKFEERAADAGLAMPEEDCTGAAFGDLDGDGDPDLVVNTLAAGTWIFRNDGTGRFERLPGEWNKGRGAMTTAMADIDGDGDLDLYIANYRVRALMDMPTTRMTFRREGTRTVVDTVQGRPATDPEFRDRFVINESGGIEENGEPDLLLRNEGGGRFVEVGWTSGAFLDESGRPLQAPLRDWGLAAMFADVNADGRPDLYVCNDFQSPDRLWINQGAGVFRLVEALALRRTSLSSMAVDFADLNRDGLTDFFVVEMLSRDHALRMRWVRENFPHRPTIGVFEDRPQLEQNTLQVGRAGGGWSELAQFSGLEATEWAWACAFLDVDLDGWEDVLVVNGMERAGRDLDVAERLKAQRAGRQPTVADVFAGRRQFPRLATANLAFRNRGDLTFQECSREWGFDLPAVSQALALADLDGDGDQDVVVGNLNEEVAVYRNEAAAPRVAVHLRGVGGNTAGVGARIEVRGGAVPVQSQEIRAGGRYLSGDEAMRVFATGAASQVALRVQWPSGRVTEVPSVPSNSRVEVLEPETAPTSPTPATGTAAERPWFDDLTAALGHRHVDAAFDDFARQPLLPYRLSQWGPGVGWIDLDGDGTDELILGSGKGGRIEGRKVPGRPEAGWAVVGTGTNAPALARDALGLAAVGGSGVTNGARVMVALANYEDGAAFGAVVAEWRPANGALADLVPAGESSPGVLAAGDMDGDGDLDLFVGGRVVPGRWPEPAASRFLRQEQGRWVADAERTRVLQGLGSVTGAVFTDLEGDGDLDLAVATEWGPVRVFRQGERGSWSEATRELGLDREAWRGRWTALASADVDQDGRPDLIVGNWGRNLPDEKYRLAPPADGSGGGWMRIYHGDFNGDGTYDVLEAWFDAAAKVDRPVHPMTVVGAALPMVRGKFPTHADYAAAGVPEILGEGFSRAKLLQASVTESGVFLQRGTGFEFRALPTEAQWAPVFGLAVADADGDGALDLFLSQNFFAVRPHVPRMDGGQGVWLRGDGKGGFQAVDGARSGVVIHGEQRGAAVSDFDGDGRVDLVVAQNGAATRLFRNTSARAGVRVRLVGPPANPLAVGARVGWAGRGGMQEIQSGSGGLSQSTLAPVLARVAAVGTEGRVRVIWPGGGTRDYPVPVDAVRVTLTWTPDVTASGR